MSCLGEFGEKQMGSTGLDGVYQGPKAHLSRVVGSRGFSPLL